MAALDSSPLLKAVYILLMLGQLLRLQLKSSVTTVNGKICQQYVQQFTALKRQRILTVIKSRHLNREDAMDRGRWKKLIKIG